MFSKTALIAAAMLAASVGGASAATYNIAITGSCDTLTLTVSGGVVVGVSNAPSGCDDGNMIGYQASVKKGVGFPGAALIASSDLGTSDSWSWAFNLKAKEGTLTGTPDGSTVFQDTFAFTYTKGHASRSGLPSATALAVAAAHQH